MSFWLVADTRGNRVDTNLKDIVFAKMLKGHSVSSSVMIISRSGELWVTNLESGFKIYEGRLVTQDKSLQGVLQIEESDEILYFITTSHIYLSSLADLIEQSKQSQDLQLKKINVKSKTTQEFLPYSKLMNKRIKIYHQQNITYLKIAGRTKSSFVYYYTRLDLEKYQTLLISSYEQTIKNEFIFSLDSPDQDAILFESYCSKVKPIRFIVLEFIAYQQQSKGADLTRRQFDVLHFSQQLTVISVSKISTEALCIFGNNSFEEQVLSLMIIYNFKQKYTLNYLNLKQVVIERVFSLSPSSKNCSFKESIKFDAFARQGKYTRYYQLCPKSCNDKDDKVLKGEVVTSDQDYIICQSANNLQIYPKIHKKAIYSRMLTQAKAQHFLIPIILSLLT